VKKEILEKKIEQQAADFRKRVGKKDPLNRRHDIIKKDEEKVMRCAFQKLGWSYARIGGLFDRDPRQIRRHLENIQQVEEKEIFVIFDVVGKRGTPNEAREAIISRLHLKPPHRTTVTAAFGVAEQFFRRDPEQLTTEEAEDIVETVGYNISVARVVNLHRIYRLWKASGEQKQEGEKARLTIEFDPERSEDQGTRELADGQQARFCCVRVCNWSGSKAQQCVPILKILSPSDKSRLSQYYLHWVFDDPYLLIDVPRPVDIDPGLCRPLDVAFALPPSQKAVPKAVSDQTTTSGRPFAISVPCDMNSSAPFEAKLKGCWIATHLALVTHRDDQYHLAPGEYLVKVEVHYIGVEVEAKCFRIISPSDWHELKMKLVDCPEATE
jgi:hypothetical protein